MYPGLIKFTHHASQAVCKVLPGRLGLIEARYFGVIDRPAWVSLRAQQIKVCGSASALVARLDLSLMVVGESLPTDGIDGYTPPAALVVAPECYDACVAYARELSALYGSTRVVFLTAQSERAYRWAEAMAERPRH